MNIKNIVNKKWCQLSEDTQYDLLLSVVDTINTMDGTTIKQGNCTVEFENGLSIAGFVNSENDYEIEIDDNAILYNPSEGCIVENEKFNGLITLKEASLLFKKDESTLRRNIKNGFFKEWVDCIKFGSTWVFDVKSLEKKYNK